MTVPTIQAEQRIPFGKRLVRILDSERTPDLALGFLLILCVLPLFWILVPPTVDGPVHLSISSTLKHLLAHDQAKLERYFEINWSPEPNLVGHGILVLLLHVVRPFTAEKILFGIYVISIPLAARYCIRSVSAHAPSWLALLIVPFTWTKLMQAGFYNFCLSLPVFYVCLGYFLRTFNRFNICNAVILGCLTLLLYFSHAMSMAMFFVSVFLLGAWLTLADKGSHRVGVEAYVKRLWLPLTALAPAAFLYAHFLVGNRGKTVAYGVGIADRFARLAVLSSLVTHRRVEMVGSVSMLLLFAGLFAIFARARVRSLRIQVSDVFLALAGLSLLILFVIPDYSSGGSAHSQRAELYPFLLLPLWFAGQPPVTPKTRRISIAIAVGISIGLWTLDVAQIRKIDDAVREYYSVAAHIESGHTVLPIVVDRYGRDSDDQPLSLRSEIFTLAACRLNPMVGAIELDNNQAASPGFVVRYKAGLQDWTNLRPGQMWNKFGGELAAGHLSEDPDYVLLYGWDPERIRANPDYGRFSPEDVLRSLERQYVLDYVSSPKHAVRLYRRSS